MSDQVNSTVGMMDSSQNLLNNDTYTPYGIKTKHNSSYATSNSLTSVNTNYTFTGREDDGNGLMYYRNRYYNPTMKRFISEDPIGGGGINQYAYVQGKPLAFNDPSGNILNYIGDNGSTTEAFVYDGEDEEFAQYVMDLQNSPIVYTIISRRVADKVINHAAFNIDGYDWETHTIVWDPHVATCDKHGHKTSPAINLAHEIGHAHDDLVNHPGYVSRLNNGFSWWDPDHGYDNHEEFYNMTGFEWRIAKILSEGQRDSHHGYQYPVNGVTNR